MKVFCFSSSNLKTNKPLCGAVYRGLEPAVFLLLNPLLTRFLLPDFGHLSSLSIYSSYSLYRNLEILKKSKLKRFSEENADDYAYELSCDFGDDTEDFQDYFFAHIIKANRRFEKERRARLEVLLENLEKKRVC